MRPTGRRRRPVIVERTAVELLTEAGTVASSWPGRPNKDSRRKSDCLGQSRRCCGHFSSTFHPIVSIVDAQ